MLTIETCLGGRKPPNLQKRSYLTGFGERKEDMPVLEDIQAGGILFTPHPAPDYYPVNRHIEDIRTKDLKCFKEVDTYRCEEKEENAPRKHNALTVGREIVYIPAIHEQFKFQTQYGRYLWRTRCTSAKPDMEYIHQLRKNIFTSLHKFLSVSSHIRINRLLLNDSIFCLSWIPPSERQRFLSLIAKVLRDQSDLVWFSAENAQLLQEDGLKLLFIVAVTSGFALETLHLWHFFRTSDMPIKPLSERSLYDPFIWLREEDVPIDTLIRYLWREYVMRNSYAIPYIVKNFMLNTALQCLEKLVVLSVEYSYLSGGQGNSLLQLGCIQNSTLRCLNLLYTQNNSPQVSKRYICARAWKEACKMNPFFRVNFVSIGIAEYDSLSQILTPFIPMDGFYVSSGIKAANKALWLGLTMQVLADRYRSYLQRITLHLYRARLMVDLTLTKLLMQFSYLEEFEYRGPMDRLSTLHALFEYILNNNLRIRKLHFYLQEDPCFQEPYRSTINEVYEQYRAKFINKHIDFELKLCKM